MTVAPTNTNDWRRIIFMRWFYGLRKPATAAFICTSAVEIVNRSYLRADLGGLWLSIRLFSVVLFALSIIADRVLLRAKCPACGDRLFAKLPPNHPGEEYFDQGSPNCVNCHVEIPTHAL